MRSTFGKESAHVSILEWLQADRNSVSFPARDPTIQSVQPVREWIDVNGPLPHLLEEVIGYPGTAIENIQRSPAVHAQVPPAKKDLRMEGEIAYPVRAQRTKPDQHQGSKQPHCNQNGQQQKHDWVFEYLPQNLLESHFQYRGLCRRWARVRLKRILRRLQHLARGR